MTINHAVSLGSSPTILKPFTRSYTQRQASGTLLSFRGHSCPQFSAGPNWDRTTEGLLPRVRRS